MILSIVFIDQSAASDAAQYLSAKADTQVGISQFRFDFAHVV
jgi:hypothetical protein